MGTAPTGVIAAPLESYADKSGYPVVIEPLSPEDGGGYLATVPDLPGCISDGDTREQAARNVADAIGAWMEAAHTLGRTIPRPTRLALAAG